MGSKAMSAARRGLRIGAKRNRAVIGEQLVENQPQLVDVRAWRQGFAPRVLRRQVPDVASDVSDVRVLRDPRLRNAEVDQLQPRPRASA